MSLPPEIVEREREVYRNVIRKLLSVSRKYKLTSKICSSLPVERMNTFLEKNNQIKEFIFIPIEMFDENFVSCNIVDKWSDFEKVEEILLPLSEVIHLIDKGEKSGSD